MLSQLATIGRTIKVAAKSGGGQCGLKSGGGQGGLKSGGGQQW